MIKFELGEYTVTLTFDKERKEIKEIELQNGTYKYVDLSFEELEELYKKVKELM